MGKRDRPRTAEERERKERKRSKKEKKSKKNKKKSIDEELAEPSSSNDQTEQAEQKSAPSATEVDAAAEKQNQGPTEKAPPKSPIKVTVPSDTTKERSLIKKKVQVTVSLLPSCLRNVQLHVENALRQFLMNYSEGMEGVLLAFENVKILEDKHAKGNGWILNELPHVHFNIMFDAFMFCPKVGLELVGVVNESFASHIGLLVYGYFNAMVSAEELRASGYTFDNESNQWMTSAGPTEIVIGQNSASSFSVKQIHECDGVMSLEGTTLKLRPLIEQS